MTGTEPVSPTGRRQDGHLSQKLEELSCWQCVHTFLPSVSVFVPLAWSLLSGHSSMPAYFLRLDRGHLGSRSALSSSVHPWCPQPSWGTGSRMT